MRRKIIIAAVVVAGLTAQGVAGRNIYTAITWTDSGPPVANSSAGPLPGTGASAPATLPPLPAAETAAVQAALAVLEDSHRSRALLSAGVKQPWPEPAAQKEFAACVRRLEGRGDVPSSSTPERLEQICGCVVLSLQRTYPASPPKFANNRAQRRHAEAVDDLAESCAQR